MTSPASHSHSRSPLSASFNSWDLSDPRDLVPHQHHLELHHHVGASFQRFGLAHSTADDKKDRSRRPPAGPNQYFPARARGRDWETVRDLGRRVSSDRESMDA